MTNNGGNASLRSRCRIVLTALTIAIVVATTEGQIAQVSPNSDARSTIATALRRERATLLGFRQVWSTANHEALFILEQVKPDRQHAVQKNDEMLLIGDSSYSRKGDGPWVAPDMLAIARSPEGDIEEEVKRIGQVRFIGTDTVDDLPALVYEYGQKDATDNALGNTRRIWIGVNDGLPHKAEDEGLFPSVTEGSRPDAEPRMINVKVVTTFDYKGAIIIDLPEPAAREAAESWLQVVDSGRYADSWTEASETLKQSYARDVWETRLNGLAKQVIELKRIKPRKLVSLQQAKSSSRNLDHEPVELTYKTYFEKSGPLVQQLKLVLDRDQIWRVANYTVALPDQFGRDASGLGASRQGGIGSDGGYGTGSGGGMGPGNGRGVGPGNAYNMGGGDPRMGGGLVGSASVDIKPVPLNEAHPQYTEEARRNKIQGNVTLRLLIGPDGLVKQAKIVRGLPDGLDEQAIQAAYQLRFKPAMKNGQPVAYWMPVIIEFKLK